MTTSEPDRRAGAEASAVSVLAVASHRPAKVFEPLAVTDLEVAALELDEDVGPLARVESATRRTRRAIRRHDPDLLLLDCFETLGAPAMWVADRHDVPVVARQVGDNWRKLDEEFLARARAQRDVPQYLRHHLSRRMNRFIFERAAGFVTVSTALADVVARRTGCPPGRVGVVPVPVTADTATGSATAARAATGVEADRVLLTVTNLNFRAKLSGAERILSAVLPLLRADSNLAYLVAGGGRHHDELLAAIDDAVDDPAVRRRIHAPGHVDAVADLYALADVFVYVSDLDGYPNVVLEAQTAGVPVVANDAHGMCDQITDGETGYLVDPDVPGALRERVESLLSDPEARRRLGEAGRDRTRRENDPAAVGERLAAFLAGLHADLQADRGATVRGL